MNCAENYINLILFDFTFLLLALVGLGHYIKIKYRGVLKIPKLNPGMF